MNKQNRSLFTILISFFIPAAIVITGFIIGGYAPFGSKDIMTSGGYSDQLVNFFHLYDHVHKSQPVLSDNLTGNNINFLSFFTFYLSDLSNLIILLFSRSAITSVLDIIYAIKIGAAGAFFCIFILNRNYSFINKNIPAIKPAKTSAKNLLIGSKNGPKSQIFKFTSSINPIAVSISIAYALGLSMLSIGSNVSYTFAIALLPLIILGLEKTVYENKYLLYILAYAVSFISSIYITCISTIFIILYFVLCDYKNIRHLVNSFLRKLAADIMVIGISFPVLYIACSSSYFKSTVNPVFPAFSYINFFDFIKGMMSSSIISHSEEYGNNCNLSISVITILTIFTYIFIKNIDAKHKIKQFILLVFIISGFAFSTFNFLFNFFVFSLNINFNFSYIFAFIILYMLYDTLKNINYISRISFFISDLLTLGVIIASIYLCTKYSSISPFMTSIELLVLYTFVIMLYQSENFAKYIFEIIISLIFIVEISSGYINNSKIIASNSKTFKSTSEYRLYATEIDLQAKHPNANTLYYNPLQNTSNIATDSITGIDYIIADSSVKNVDAFIKSEYSKYGYTIYENPYSLHGLLFNKDSKITSYSYNPDYPFESINILSKYHMSLNPVFYDNPSGGNVKSEETVSSYKYTAIPSIAGYTYANANYLAYLGKTSSGKSYTFTQNKPDNTVTALYPQIYNINKSNFDIFYNHLKNNSARFSASENLYKVHCDTDKYLLINAPSPDFIRISVNGNRVKYIKSSQNFIIVPVSEGENSIHIYYTAVPAVISIFVFLFTLLFALFCPALIRKCSKDTSKIQTFYNSFISFIQKYKVYISVLLISSFVFITGIMLTSSHPLGKNYIISGDGLIQAFSSYVNTVREVKNGTFFQLLDTHIDLLLDKSGNIATLLMTPWLYIKYKLLPQSMYEFDFTFTLFLKYAFAGLFFILFLTHRKYGKILSEQDTRLIPLGVMYGLSSYCISYFMYGDFNFMAYMPLILLGLENLIYKKKSCLYITALFIFMQFDAYYAYMMCIMIILYFLLEIRFTSVRDFFMKGIRTAVCSIASAGLAAVFLVPYYIKTTASAYKSADSVYPSISSWFTSPLKCLLEYRPFKLSTIVTDDSYKANIYCGIAVLIFIPVYFMLKDIKLIDKLRRGIFLIFLFLAFDNELLNFIMHGLHYQSRVPNRFSCFFIFMLLLSLYEVILYTDKLKYKTTATGMLISSAMILAAYIWGLIRYSSDSSITAFSYKMSIIIISVYIAVILFRIIQKKELIRYILMLSIIELILGSSMDILSSIGASSNNFSNYTTNINYFSQSHKDMKNDFTVSELIDSSNSYSNLANFTNMNNISGFSSNATIENYAIYDTWGIIHSTNLVQYLNGSPLSNMMLRVKYHITNLYSESSGTYFKDKVDQSENLELYKNDYYIPMGIMIPDKFNTSKWEEKYYQSYKSSFERDNEFSNIFKAGNIYDVHKLKYSSDKENTKSGSYYTHAAVNPDSDENITFTFHIDKSMKGDIYLSYLNISTYLGTCDGKNDADFTIDLSPSFLSLKGKHLDAQIGVFNKTNFTKLYNTLSSETCTTWKMNNTNITSSITTSKSGNLFISLPDYSGFKAYVDGKETPVKSYLGGIGIHIENPGTHKITLTYHPKGYLSGGFITLITIFVLTIISVIKKKKNKHNINLNDENTNK